MIKIDGSDKQVKWATDIINGALETIKSNKEQVQKEYPAGILRDKELAAWGEAERQYNELLATIDGKPKNAALIIEKRDYLDSEALCKLVGNLNKK